MVESAFDDVSVRTVEKSRYERSELIEIIGDARGLFIHSENTFDEDVIGKAPNLRAIAKPGSGIDNIDVDVATEEEVVVLHTPGMNAVAVAEFTVGAVLSQLRMISDAEAHLAGGGWRSQDWWGGELRGKSVGIIGLGAAGLETAKRFEPFCEELLVYDPYVSDERIDSVSGTRLSLEELLSQSDVVSLHVRLTPETRGLLCSEELDHMKDTALLVNTSRGEVVEQKALIDALENDRIGGAVLDVFHTEPPDSDSPLVERDDVLATPHLAGATVETRTRMLNVTARNLVSVLNGETVDEEYVANPASL